MTFLSDRPLSLPRLISFAALVGFIIALAFVFYRVMASFVLPMFLAALLVVIFRPVHYRILLRCKGRIKLASGITTAVVMLAVLLPIGYVFVVAASEGVRLASELEVATMKERLSAIRARMGLTMPHADEIRKIERTLDRAHEEDSFPSDEARDDAIASSIECVNLIDKHQTEHPSINLAEERFNRLRDALHQLQVERVGSPEFNDALREARLAFNQLKNRLFGGPTRVLVKGLANPTDDQLQQLQKDALDLAQRWLAPVVRDTAAFIFRIVVGSLILIVSLYFFLADGPVLLAQLMRLSPLDDRYERELLLEFEQISRAVVLATLLSALAQAILAGLGFWVVGFDSVFLLTLVTFVLAMIPFVGAAAIWIPASFWLAFVEERIGAGIGLAIYGTLGISAIDNVIKPFVLHGESKLHPLLALLSILGGIQALGPIGIIVGPMVVALLQAMLNILHRELLTISKLEQAEDDARRAGETAPES